MKRVLAVLATGAVMAPIGLVQPAAAAKTYKACVKKSTGETRLLVGKAKKCKKGWKKVTWGKTAPTGDSGPTGAQGPSGSVGYFGNVVDVNGAFIGKSVGNFVVGVPLGLYQVLIDGGVYSYLGNGWLYPVSSAYYLDAACTGAPFAPASDVEELASLTGPELRLVWRTAVGTALGPAKAFKPAGTPAGTLMNVKTYRVDEAGACVVADASFTGYRVDLTEIPAPPDRPGPLRFT